jgi:prepilin-type N-terminal cleavage/methylation domain-containing protein
MEKRHSLGSRGFTLIEVLISTLILGLILSLTLRAGSNFMGVWQRDDKLFSNVFDSARNRILLRESVESLYDYYVTDKSGEDKDRYFPLFEGDAMGITFITLSSVFNHGSPALARLAAEKNDSGSYNLVYKEADLERHFIKYAQDKRGYSDQIIVYGDVEKVRFRFYGVVDTRFDQLLTSVTRIFGWRGEFSGKEKGYLPNVIELDISSDETGDKIIVYNIKIENRSKNGIFNPPFKR